LNGVIYQTSVILLCHYSHVTGCVTAGTTPTRFFQLNVNLLLKKKKTAAI